MKIKKNIALLRAIAALSLFGAAGADAGGRDDADGGGVFEVGALTEICSKAQK